MLGPIDGGERYELTSPTALPQAGGFLWNRRMMIQMTCRGSIHRFQSIGERRDFLHACNIT